MHSHSGEMLEWLKRHAWKACIRQNRISGSNPDLSATKKTAAFLQNAAFFAPSASSSLAKPEAWKSHDMLRISAVLSQPFLLVARAPRRALRECAALQGEHNPDEGAWRVLRLQARLQSRRCGKAMICSAYQPFCPSRSSLLQGPRGEHNPDGGAWQVFRLQARLQSRRRGMRRKNGNLSYYFPPHSHLASFGIIDNQ